MKRIQDYTNLEHKKKQNKNNNKQKKPQKTNLILCLDWLFVWMNSVDLKQTAEEQTTLFCHSAVTADLHTSPC